ncbi:MAG TPA: hypothetical protein VMA37_18645 [Acetobacteraceae bacterium]|nr:hypothetical protein [Acetobacteraceae bacterium]
MWREFETIGELAANADMPVFHRRVVTAQALIFALDSCFTDRTFTRASDRDVEQLRFVIGAVARLFSG